MNKTDRNLLKEYGIPDDLIDEMLSADQVQARVNYVNFVSRSKGRRKGIQRRRREVKEVRLIQYPKGGTWRTWDRFPFDEYAAEIMNVDDAEALKRRIIELWGY